MRGVWILFLLPLLAFAQEGPEPEKPDDGPPRPAPAYDEFGFPVTFNEEIITLSDLERELGIKLRDPQQIVNARDGVLMRLLGERVAVRLGIEVDQQDLDRWMMMRVDEQGGDAKFYEFLAQRGDTLERFREQQRQLLLQRQLAYLFQTGIARDGRKLLPWRVRPTPRELALAWKNDETRKSAGLRIRLMEFMVNLDRKERQKLATRQVLEGLTPEQVEEIAAAKLQGRVDQVMADLQGGRPFEEVAKEQGVDVDAQKKAWIELPVAISRKPAERFLQEAKQETFSQPLALAGGGYRVLYLLERKRPNPRGLTDPEVAREYEMRIRELRGRKWESYLRLKALDASTIRPQRVADDLRKIVVAELRDAEDGLRALGIH